MRSSDWSSDVCSADLSARTAQRTGALYSARWPALRQWRHPYGPCDEQGAEGHHRPQPVAIGQGCALCPRLGLSRSSHRMEDRRGRSEEHRSELQSLMRISYAVFCLKKQKQNITKQKNVSNKQ